jgi:hypothetical protein
LRILLSIHTICHFTSISPINILIWFDFYRLDSYNNQTLKLKYNSWCGYAYFILFRYTNGVLDYKSSIVIKSKQNKKLIIYLFIYLWIIKREVTNLGCSLRLTIGNLIIYLFIYFCAKRVSGQPDLNLDFIINKDKLQCFLFLARSTKDSLERI